VKLLLDEHYSPRIAKELRRRGHDVVMARERSELRGLTDPALFAMAVAERRAIVTENAADFLPLLAAAAIRGDDHFGIVLTSPRQFPRRRRGIRLVTALDAFLTANHADDGLRGQSWWLEPIA
jgi:predicted nuclease of predicted toxin-antitoxin system